MPTRVYSAPTFAAASGSRKASCRWPVEQAESGAWWDLTAEDAGLRVDLYESEYEVIFDENGELAFEMINILGG